MMTTTTTTTTTAGAVPPPTTTTTSTIIMVITKYTCVNSARARTYTFYYINIILVMEVQVLINTRDGQYSSGHIPCNSFPTESQALFPFQ